MKDATPNTHRDRARDINEWAGPEYRESWDRGELENPHLLCIWIIHNGDIFL